MAQAIRIHHAGGPEAMQLETVALGAPAAGQARVRQTAIGLNYIDVYHRNGVYPQPLPSGIGLEAAGVVEAVGAGVEHVQAGDRVVYAGGPPGAYASERVMPAAVLVKLPDTISDETAAAMMLQGLTVQYLFRRTYRLQAGETVLLHAAAGGVGLIACQWARALGVNLIGTVGSDEKAELARAQGCTHVINYQRENVVERVRAITHGKGVPVVYDGVGRDTFTTSLDCLAPFGLLVSYGNASGVVPPFSINELFARGSLYLTRPGLFHYTQDRHDLESMSAELFEMVSSGQIRIDIRQRYALADAAQAHRDLEARRTTGSTILLP